VVDVGVAAPAATDDRDLGGSRKTGHVLARELLCQPAAAVGQDDDGDRWIQQPWFVCWHCGQAMAILQTFTRGNPIRALPTERAQ
jgi:hypothetical protein